MARKSKKNQSKRGGFGRLVIVILIAWGAYAFWRHNQTQTPAPRGTGPHGTVTGIDAAVAASMGKPIPKPGPAPQPQPQPQPADVSTQSQQPQQPQQTQSPEQSQQPQQLQQSPSVFPRPVQDILEAQVALARREISPGSIDGVGGAQTREAISVFQETANLPVTGELDDQTRSNLTLDAPILMSYPVTTNDLDSLQPLGTTWLAKSQQSSLAYETEVDLVAEKSHSSPTLIKKLNPNVDWSTLSAGTVLQIPAVNYPDPDTKAAFVVIHLSDRYLEAFDQQTNLILHFPCSIARKVEKRPVGELHVIDIIPNPNYTVDPALFPESDELQKIGHKVILPPGPRNPVGVAWMGLDRPGYGMHGTPNAQQVGRTESHGCFRLANWDASYLSQIVWVGMPVEVVN